MKSTSVLSAVALSFVLAAISGSAAVAQEYITTQSVELNQAIARAEQARSDAEKEGSVRGQQISKYISGVLAQAKDNQYASAEELTRVLNEAATATPLLLGLNQNNTKTTESVSTTSTHSTVARTSYDSEPVAMLAEPNGTTTVAEMTEPIEAASVATFNTEPTTTTVKVEVKAQPEIVATTANPDDNTIVLANATVRSNVNDITGTPETVDVPNTGETKNPVGKFIATGVAAIVAMGGAILIVKRMKKNA